MLSTQFFTRVQLAKILGYKSDGFLKDFEKKRFLIPQIKPSKFTFNQVLFMMICKEIINSTNLSWKDFIDAKFNTVLKENLIDFKLLLLYQYRNTNQPELILSKDEAIARNLRNFLDGDLLDDVSKIKNRENITYESIPSFLFYRDTDYDLIIFSIDRIYQKLHNKCTELKIDLREKILA